MKKLTDEELDSVFKSAAEGNTPPFEQAAWDAMAQKLDAPRPAPVWRRWAPILLLGTTIFLTGVWVGRTSMQSDSTELTEKKIQIEKNKNASNAEGLNENEANDLTVLPEVKNDFNKESRARVSLVSESRSNNLYQKEKQSDLKVLHEEKREEFPKVVGLIALGNEVQQKNLLAEKELAIDSITLVKSAVDSIDLGKELEDKPEGRRDYGLFIRFLASPDLSSVKFGPTELGSNFGLLGEFAFSDRLSLSTGVIRAKKNYESYQEEAYGSSARHLVGSCSILDVPLNITYYFPSRNHFSVYVTTGASSYLMLREDYIYTIKSNTGDRVYPYQAIRKNNEWFKVLNLAIGVQYRLAPRWHVQLEPYIKAPLADLGERNVRLSSLGVFGGLRYQLHSKVKNP